ncbi:MAG: hypothetical protein JEY96_05305 [Bacteroidales bacterium]|nr:hypothetical protein [Bacteroidales bacterium]
MNKLLMKVLGLFLIVTIYVSCEELSEEDLIYNSEVISIEYGKSFGECNGYCDFSLTLTENTLNYKVSSFTNAVQYPEISRTIEIDSIIWLELREKVDFLLFRNLNEVIGCPDCADEGAEWVKLETRDISHKVTFEYENEPEEIEDLVDGLRELMDEYEFTLDV